MMRLPYLRFNEQANATRVVPFILAVGNHDLGVNTYSGRDLLQDENDSRPVFKHFYPQNTHNGEIPLRENRRTFYAKRFSDRMLIISLDTGYENEVADQVDFVKQELDGNFTYKFAMYHNPMYSA